MPAYDYHCERCGDFEVQRRMSDPALDACPNCSGPVTRVFSRNVNFLFKGSGFYITDYRKEGYKQDAAADSASAAPAASPAPAAPAAPSSPAPSAGPASGSSSPAPASGGTA